MDTRRQFAVAGLVAAVVVIGGWYFFALGGGFETPTVESVDSAFGDVSRERTVIDSRVVVDNPNNGSLPGGSTVHVAVDMNGVRVAEGRGDLGGLDPGRNVLNLSVPLDNARIPAWWVTHVNRGGRTVITTRPSVSAPGLPLNRDLAPRNRSFETDILGPLAASNASTVTVANQSVLVVSNRTARWGEADGERTPVVFSTALRNVHDEPVRLDGTEYVVRMNGVTVGEGRTDDTLRLAPGEAATYTSRAVIDTPRMRSWWVSHVRADQTTELVVEVHGVVERDGARERVPLRVYSERVRFETDFFGTGETTTVPLEPPEDDRFRPPSVAATDSDWGEVGEETTEIVTDATVTNPNDRALDVLILAVDRRTTINDVAVAATTSRVSDLPPGNSTHRLSGRMAHDTVPRWWAHHLDRGERSTVVTELDGRADVGVTALDVPLADRERTVETDVLASFENDSRQRVESEGETLVTITDVSAEWGEATPERAPVELAITVENHQPTTVTVSDLDYAVALNDVTLADRRADEQFQVGPLETRTLELTLPLNNSRMAAWWPTHVRNGERSTLHTEAHATVATATREERVRLDSITGDRSVETTVLVDQDDRDDTDGRDDGGDGS